MARKKKVRKNRKSTQRTSGFRNKIPLVVRNLLLFIAMSLVSFVLYRFIPNTLLTDLFYIMAIVFGFVAVAFLIVLLVLWIMKIIKK